MPGGFGLDLAAPVATLLRSLPGECPSGADPMKIKIRNSKTKKQKQHGFRTRQKTKGGRKTNKRQRARHGSF